MFGVSISFPPLSLPALDILLRLLNCLYLPDIILRFSTLEFARFTKLHHFRLRHPVTFAYLQPTLRMLCEATSSLIHPLRYFAIPSSIFRRLSRHFPHSAIPSLTFVDFTPFLFCVLNLPSARFHQFLSRPSLTLHELLRCILRCFLIFAT
jgi:hypothetical protein